MAVEQIINLKKERKIDTDSDKLPSVYSNEPLISWQARDHLSGERSYLWYITVIIIGLALMIWALWTFNFLFAFFVLIATVALIIASSRQPKIYNISIFPHGVEIEGLPPLYFSDIESFWIFPATNPPILSLRPRHHIQFPTYLLLENINPEKIHEVLLNYIPEQEEELPFVERLTQLIGL